MLNHNQETVDLLCRRIASQIKLIREMVPTGSVDDYKSSVVKACEQIIHIMESKGGGRASSQLGRKM